MSEDCHVGMYLVADDKDIVVVAEIGKFYECFLVPAYSSWVVWIAEDEQFAFLIIYVGKLLEVYFVVAVVFAS